MRRGTAFKRGRAATILVAGAVGYLLGDWHATTLRSANLSPAETVAMRFPEAGGGAAIADAAPATPASATSPMSPTSAMVLGRAQLALLSPEPIVPQIVPQSAPQAPVQNAAVEEATASPTPEAMPAHRPMPVAPRSRAELKSPVDGASRRANRPGFMLNDAQIASIKGRLHLTPDQERMWPAVEAALRHVAYVKAHDDANRRGTPASTEGASLDPDSVEVQGLKSAAFPLILSFSDEQKNEVRSLAHVMGLDRLASEF
jgi:hypothetical protein